MKLSDLTTDRAADVLCECSIYISNICADAELLDTLRQQIDTDGKSRAELLSIAFEQYAKLVPLLLKAHRNDVFGILAAINGAKLKDIKAQSLMTTMEQIRELATDTEFIAFFKSRASASQ